MRTQEQISNLRYVLFGIIGPMAAIMTDADINAYADEIQRQVDNLPDSKPQWSLSVKMLDDKDTPWSKIEPEPTMPIGTIEEMNTNCIRLLRKFFMVYSIRIQNVDRPDQVYIFERDKND